MKRKTASAFLTCYVAYVHAACLRYGNPKLHNDSDKYLTFGRKIKIAMNPSHMIDKH
jgi:hypothetical protein